MDYKLEFMNFLIAHFLLTLPLSIMFVYSSTINSCNQTPYPEICNHFLSKNNLVRTLDNKDISFRNLALKVTMEKAVEAYQRVSNMNLNSFNDRAKIAWNDCLALYEDTIRHLNRSLSSHNHVDAQTWLSAALANQKTCHNGFMDFNLSYPLASFPIMSSFSKFLRNSLAINKALASSSSFSVDAKTVGHRRLLESPSWVSASDRRLLQSSTSAVVPRADIVVAQDGSGEFKTINEAVSAAARRNKEKKRFVIYVKGGIYKENVEIKKSTKNLMIVGDGIGSTIVSGNRNVQDGSTTFRSATFAVSGDGFIARDIAFENIAGPQKHQAVALRCDADFSVFYRCSFRGYQDTLYVHSQRQFYRNCDVYGTVDFIFGDAIAILQNCNIYVRKPLTKQKNTITAQARTDPNENTGIIVQNSRVTASSDLIPVQNQFRSYLGRPWQKYSRTVFIKCVLDGLIDPAGWLEWSGNFGLSTLYYGEYFNTGIGASTRDRVKWPGYHVISNPTEAGKFTVGNFLVGGSWIATAEVPFNSGL